MAGLLALLLAVEVLSHLVAGLLALLLAVEGCMLHQMHLRQMDQMNLSRLDVKMRCLEQMALMRLCRMNLGQMALRAVSVRWGLRLRRLQLQKQMS